MKKNFTLLKKIKTTKSELPRKFIINNLMNYSKSLQTIPNPFGGSFVLSNN